MISGRRRQRLMTDGTRKAFLAAIEWEGKTRHELNANAGQVVTMAGWMENYLQFAKVRFQAKTYRAKKAAFRRLLSFFRDTHQVAGLSVADCLRFLTTQARTRSGNAANRDRKEAGTAYEWGRVYLGLPVPNPWRLVDKFPEKSYTRYVPPLADFEKVRAIATGQDAAMLTTLLHLAPRKSELFGIRLDDVDFENRRVRLFTRKRKGGHRQGDFLPATKILMATLAAWLEERGKIELPGQDPETNYVFLSLVTGRRFQRRDDFLKRLCQRAGVRRFSFHAVRHLAAQELYRDGATTHHIQLVLRHLDPRTTSKYLRRIGIEEVRATMEKTLH